MGHLRKLQRRVVREEAEVEEAGSVPEDHLKLPVGQILTSPVKGDFFTIPMYGWFSRRVKTDTPLLMLGLMLFRSMEDPQGRGTLQVELPIFDETELATLAALERYGWDGRVWPHEPGWPEGSAEEELTRVVLERSNLVATLTFPPSEEHGIAAQAVSVTRARGPFLMPPLPEPTVEVDPEKLLKFRELYKNPQKFLSPASV